MMNKTALITGASSGIGEALSRLHAQRGGNLVIIARSREKLESLRDELERAYGIQVMVLVKDLTEEGAAQQVYDGVKQEGIVIDYLINNAGFGGLGLFHERDWDTDRAMIQLNIVALTALTRKFLPDFVARGAGKILNVSSTASLMPGPLQAVYFATKAYVTSLSNALAEELKDSGVTVTTLLPGATETEFGKRSGMEDTKLFDETATATEVAQAGYEGMLRGDLDVLAGLSMAQKVMMKSIPVIPKKILMAQVKKMQETKE